MCNIRSGTFRCQISTSIKDILEHISRYRHFKIRDLENVGQGHDVQHSQWRCSTENT